MKDAKPATPLVPAVWIRGVVRLTGAVGCLALMAFLAHLPLGAEPEDGALRLALRTTAGRLEVCRDPTSEEVAARPAHMQRAQICEELVLAYRLEGRVDGELRFDQVVVARGLRKSRPLVYDRTIGFQPGRHELDLRFFPEVPSDAPPEFQAAIAEAPVYELRQTIDIDAGQIVVASIDDSGLRLTTR